MGDPTACESQGGGTLSFTPSQVESISVPFSLAPTEALLSFEKATADQLGSSSSAKASHAKETCRRESMSFTGTNPSRALSPGAGISMRDTPHVTAIVTTQYMCPHDRMVVAGYDDGSISLVRFPEGGTPNTPFSPSHSGLIDTNESGACVTVNRLTVLEIGHSGKGMGRGKWADASAVVVGVHSIPVSRTHCALAVAYRDCAFISLEPYIATPRASTFLRKVQRVRVVMSSSYLQSCITSILAKRVEEGNGSAAVSTAPNFPGRTRTSGRGAAGDATSEEPIQSILSQEIESIRLSPCLKYVAVALSTPSLVLVFRIPPLASRRVPVGPTSSANIPSGESSPEGSNMLTEVMVLSPICLLAHCVYEPASKEFAIQKTGDIESGSRHTTQDGSVRASSHDVTALPLSPVAQLFFMSSYVDVSASSEADMHATGHECAARSPLASAAAVSLLLVVWPHTHYYARVPLTETHGSFTNQLELVCARSISLEMDPQNRKRKAAKSRSEAHISSQPSAGGSTVPGRPSSHGEPRYAVRRDVAALMQSQVIDGTTHHWCAEAISYATATPDRCFVVLGCVGGSLHLLGIRCVLGSASALAPSEKPSILSKIDISYLHALTRRDIHGQLEGVHLWVGTVSTPRMLDAPSPLKRVTRYGVAHVTVALRNTGDGKSQANYVSDLPCAVTAIVGLSPLPLCLIYLGLSSAVKDSDSLSEPPSVSQSHCCALLWDTAYNQVIGKLPFHLCQSNLLTQDQHVQTVGNTNSYTNGLLSTNATVCVCQGHTGGNSTSEECILWLQQKECRSLSEPVGSPSRSHQFAGDSPVSLLYAVKWTYASLIASVWPLHAIHFPQLSSRMTRLTLSSLPPQHRTKESCVAKVDLRALEMRDESALQHTAARGLDGTGWGGAAGPVKDIATLAESCAAVFPGIWLNALCSTADSRKTQLAQLLERL